MIGSMGQAMRESWAYQEILREGEALGEARGEVRGRAEEARRLLLRLGRQRLGEPDPATAAALTDLADVERIERMIERLLEAASWTEVLATP